MGKAERLESFGNKETMNFNEILYQNVQASQYLKNLSILTTYEEVLDEIKLRVTNLEHNIPNSPNPYATVSTAFCLLFKLWTLKLTVRQVEQMVTSNRSVYIRCLGFLYLRYTYPPAKLMEWFEDFLGDEDKVKLRAGDQTTTTVGQFVRDLLLNKKYMGATMLPTIPVPVMKAIEDTIRKFDEETVEETKEPRRGDRDDDDDDDVNRRPAAVRRSPPPQRRAGSRSPVRSRSPASTRDRPYDRGDRDRVDRERSDRDRSDRDRSDRDRSDRDRSDRERGDRERSDRERGDRERSDRDRGDRERSDRDRVDRDRTDRDRDRSDRDRDRTDRDRDRTDWDRSDRERSDRTERDRGRTSDRGFYDYRADRDRSRSRSPHRSRH